MLSQNKKVLLSAVIITDKNDCKEYKIKRALQYVYLVHWESNTYLTPVFANEFKQEKAKNFKTTKFLTQKYDKSNSDFTEAKGKLPD